MKRIHFVVNGKPKPLVRHRDMYGRDGKPMMVVGKGGKKYNPKRDPSKKDKENFLLESMNSRPGQPIMSPTVLACLFYMPVPKSRKDIVEAVALYEEHFADLLGSEMIIDQIRFMATALDNKIINTITHTPTPDESNLKKFVEDALEGPFWKNDSCLQSFGWKMYGTKPRTEIEILW